MGEGERIKRGGCEVWSSESAGLLSVSLNLSEGWLGGAIVLSKFLMPRRPTDLDNSRARAYCGYWLFGHCFFSRLLFCLFFFGGGGEIVPYRLKCSIKLSTAIKPKTTNQPTQSQLITASTVQ